MYIYILDEPADAAKVVADFRLEIYKCADMCVCEYIYTSMCICVYILIDRHIL